MARNLGTSNCCGLVVRLSDLRDKKIEFRQYGNEPPSIGTRWDCPSCKTAYFVIWRDPEMSFTTTSWIRGFTLDLSYYESFDDEHSNTPLDSPRHLCLGNAENWQENGEIDET